MMLRAMTANGVTRSGLIAKYGGLRSYQCAKPACRQLRVDSRTLVVSRAEEKDNLESLFAEELKRRGLDSMDGGESSREEAGPTTTTSTSKSPFATKTTPRTRPAGADSEDQRQRSIALVNEGLEGLIPRASELLKLGASVFLAFLPFIAAISLLFGGIYMVFGESFVHGGDRQSGLPAYVDPQTLLSEPTVDPYVPYQ